MTEDVVESDGGLRSWRSDPWIIGFGTKDVVKDLLLHPLVSDSLKFYLLTKIQLCHCWSIV